MSVVTAGLDSIWSAYVIRQRDDVTTDVFTVYAVDFFHVMLYHVCKSVFIFFSLKSKGPTIEALYKPPSPETLLRHVATGQQF